MKDELYASGKEWEKKFKNSDMINMGAQEERDLAERQRKQALMDRDDLQSELDTIASNKNVLYEEKRRLETKIGELEEELEDEQNNNEQMLDKFKKVQFDLEKMTTDLNIERSNCGKNENAKILMEKQNRELRDKLVELEEVAKGRSKSVISNLEAKVAAVEEQLHLEANEKHRIAREYKKSEKRLREMQAQIEEERKLTENYKEQLDKMQSKLKTNKRLLDENEEEITQLKNKSRKIQRDLEEANEQNEMLNQSMTALRTKNSKMNLTTTSLLPSKYRQNGLAKLINDTVGDFDDDLDDTLSQSNLTNGNSIKLESNGSNHSLGNHNSSNVSSLNSSGSGATHKESPSS